MPSASATKTVQISLPARLFCQKCYMSGDGGTLHRSGEKINPANLKGAKSGLQAAYDDGIRSCAIVLMHGYRYPNHEQQIATIARNIGFTQVSVSHEVSP